MVEQRAIQVVSLRCEVRKETYGRADHFNWKKVGLSRNPDERAIPLGNETRAYATSTKHHFQHDLLDEDLIREYHETQRDSRSN